MFPYGDEKNKIFSFESCKIRFDARLVLYGTKRNNKNIVTFDEIYKIEENDNMLEKNTLGKIIHSPKEMQLSGFNSSIWKRRKSLNGKVFNAVSKYGPSITISVKQFRGPDGKIVTQHSGYVSDIMRHLMKSLNFSVSTKVVNMSYNDIVKEVGPGSYDIGYYRFARNLLRDDYVDFSFELLIPNYGLYYVKEGQNSCMRTFLYPFTSHAWIWMSTYAVVMISGFILVSMVIDNKNRNSTRKIIIDRLQKGTNIVLRSVISKRQSSEPINCSSKISF